MTLALSRAKALVFAFALALVATFGLAATAPNASAVAFDDTANPALIDPDAEGSITVHKFLRDSPATGQNLTGAPVDDTSGLGKPVSNVTFKLYVVTQESQEGGEGKYDLTTTEGFKEARELVTTKPAKDFATNEYVASGYGVGDSGARPTGADGTLTFSGLYPGLYVIAEQPSPDATVDGSKVVLNPSEPFYVFVPMTNADRTGWNYDVHAYPKNSTSTITKEVSDEDANSGDDITYTLNSDVPVLSKDGELSKYSVIDQLDERLTVGDVTVKTSTDTEFASGTDYTLTTDGNKVVVTFTDAGLKKLAEQKKADNDIKVVTTINATLPQIEDGTGIIENEASLIPNDGVSEGDITSNKVETKLAKVHLTKVFKDGASAPEATESDATESTETTSPSTESEAADGEGNGENGESDQPAAEGADSEAASDQPAAADGRSATFQVYRCADSESLDGDPLTINGEDEFTTGENGELTIDALHYTDFANNEDATEGGYCLVETKTADGYELLPEAIYFEVSQDTVKDNVVELGDVENLKETGVTLPFTGGHGIGLLLGLGAVVVAGGVFLAARSSRRSKAQG